MESSFTSGISTAAQGIAARKVLYAGRMHTATEIEALELQPVQGVTLCGRFVSKPSKPVDAVLFAEPGESALGVAAGNLPNGAARLVHGQSAAEHRAEFAIADEIERLGVFGQTAFQ